MVTFKMKSPMDMIKHILTLHDGEVRRVGEEQWVPFPASGGEIAKACFWQYQFCNKAETRALLYERSQEEWWEEDLPEDLIEKIMETEGNETTLLKWETDYAPASGGLASTPSLWREMVHQRWQHDEAWRHRPLTQVSRCVGSESSQGWSMTRS